MRFLRTCVVAVVALVLAAILSLWYETYLLGGMYARGGIFLRVLGAATPLLAVGLATMLVRLVWRAFAPMLLCCALLALNGCSYATSNVQTLITNNCGVSWELVPAGQSIPWQAGPCAYKVTVPDYPMQGETKFKTSFKDRVLAEVEVGYEYAIVDAKVFMGEAKYLGKSNSEGEDSSNASSAYESAENQVIDKRIREASTTMLLSEDIVDFSQAEFEDRLLAQTNESLKSKGVRLNFLSFVPTPEEQTRLAIDMMTAMKIYESRGLSELGKNVSVARAGASKIDVKTEVLPVKPE